VSGGAWGEPTRAGWVTTWAAAVVAGGGSSHDPTGLTGRNKERERGMS
jgi:hypothetical protein